jgi:PHD/YefM family antitoxin component YafN of YafNO toxin-antitoxin module
MIITHQTVVDSEGKPAAALIPWPEFLLIQEILESGAVSDEEAAALREAEADRRSGNGDAFTDLDSLKSELAL